MNVAIVNIGDELLSGKTLNTNSFWIKRILSSHGFHIQTQITVKDEAYSIVSGLNFCISNNPDYLFLSGGMGSTDDDITREVLFNYVNTKTKIDLEYFEILKRNYEHAALKTNESIKKQALIPEIGEIIPNPNGSARGLKFKKNNTIIYALPGVPNEMKYMVSNQILPQIVNLIQYPILSRTLRTCGISESKLHDLIGTRNNIDQNKIGYYPSVYGVDITISNKKSYEINYCVKWMYKLFGTYIYAENEDNMEDIIIKNCTKHNQTLSIAESCTGGLIGDRVTNVNGSSNVFKGGLVAYSNESKVEILGVSKKILDQYGSVSKETALSMSKNVKKLFNSSIGLSVTGIAGPGGATEDKPVGLVYIGLATDSNTAVKKYNFSKDRKRNKIKTSQMALEFLRRGLLSE